MKKSPPSFAYKNSPKHVTRTSQKSSIQLLQHSCLFSHLQQSGSFRHCGQITVPQPTHLLSGTVHAQCLHSVANTSVIISRYKLLELLCLLTRFGDGHRLCRFCTSQKKGCKRNRTRGILQQIAGWMVTYQIKVILLLKPDLCGSFGSTIPTTTTITLHYIQLQSILQKHQRSYLCFGLCFATRLGNRL
jgi:hypothetical protein